MNETSSATNNKTELRPYLSPIAVWALLLDGVRLLSPAVPIFHRLDRLVPLSVC